MSEILKSKIGKIVLETVSKDFEEKTGHNYSLNNYVADFEGNDEELSIAIIKMAAKLL